MSLRNGKQCTSASYRGSSKWEVIIITTCIFIRRKEYPQILKYYSQFIQWTKYPKKKLQRSIKRKYHYQKWQEFSFVLSVNTLATVTLCFLNPSSQVHHYVTYMRHAYIHPHNLILLTKHIIIKLSHNRNYVTLHIFLLICDCVQIRFV